jgi:hypothetical protein
MAFVRSLLSVSALIVISALSGCFDRQGSDLKTLDAFSSNQTNKDLRCSAQGTDKSNIESHPYWRYKHKILPATALSTARKDALIKQSVVALTAVPEPLVELFFATGDLRITSEASVICAGHTGKDESEGFAGCIVALTDDGKVSHSIIADASDYGVSGTVVRSFGYWISQNLSGLYAAAGKTYSLTSNSKSFMENQRQITDLYFRDVVKGNKFDIGHFDSFFGKNGTAKVRYNVLATKNESLSGVTFNTKTDEPELLLKRRQQFESFVFAESFDSFLCNAYAKDATNTNKAFLDLFPETHAKFASVLSTIELEVKTYLGAEKSKKALSFNLQNNAPTAGSGVTPAAVIAEPIVTGNAQPVAPSTTSSEATPPPTSSVPATTPSTAKPTIKPDAVTIVIDAQGKIIDDSQIEVIRPENGLDQDLNIEIINQGEPESGVQIGGLQPVVPLDSNVISPIAPVSPVQPVQPVVPIEPAQPITTQQPGNQQHPGQQPQPDFPISTGQESDIIYPDFNQWPGGGGFHGCGG